MTIKDKLVLMQDEKDRNKKRVDSWKKRESNKRRKS